MEHETSKFTDSRNFKAVYGNMFKRNACFRFESSETLAISVISTPLLEESWRQCGRANTKAPRSYVVHTSGKVAYVAFSGVQLVEGWTEERCGDLGEYVGIFGSFSRRVEGAEAAAVHAGLLQLFLNFYNCPVFQQLIHEIQNECQSIIFTGHSLGGAIASLSALWLLSEIQTASSSMQVFCITYGSPMLGNKCFSQAILQERWAGNFCHVVAQHDLLPRLLFAPSHLFVPHLQVLFHLWHSYITTSQYITQHVSATTMHTELFGNVLACNEARSIEGEQVTNSFWPFGCYIFCTEKGAICLDNAAAIVKFLYLMMSNGSANSCIEDHLKYEYFVRQVCWQYLLKTGLMDASLSESNSDEGIALALQSSGLNVQERSYKDAHNCLLHARQLGYKRSLNTAKMAPALAKITPLRAQVELYKAFCDDCDDKLGYYDSFKLRGASKRGNKVNLNRIKLGQFWDELIEKIETNKLTHDFHKLPKYVNAAHFYKLLVEPLEIAEYYRNNEHRKKGHYIEYGRERRFKIFDKWWRDRKVGDEESNPRTKFASLTQDPCFWARVEEARDYVYKGRGEIDAGRRLVMLEQVENFEQYATGMINRKEVSLDVLAENSSYNLFTGEWKDLKCQLQVLSPRFTGFQDGMVQ